MENLTEKQLKQRQLAPMKSGAYAYLRSGLIPCEHCLFGKDTNEDGVCECSQVKQFQEERIEEIRQLPQVREPDLPIIISLEKKPYR